jgi:hypothetical protein
MYFIMNLYKSSNEDPLVSCSQSPQRHSPCPGTTKLGFATLPPLPQIPARVPRGHHTNITWSSHQYHSAINQNTQAPNVLPDSLQSERSVLLSKQSCSCAIARDFSPDALNSTIESMLTSMSPEFLSMNAMA